MSYAAAPQRPDVLLVDNYDSFTHNLAQYLGQLGASVEIRRNDAIDLAGIEAMQPRRVVLSPGPGHPANERDFGVCGQLVQGALTRAEDDSVVPLLGVCLGHQGLGHFHGAKVVRAPTIMHGKTSIVLHNGDELFAGLPASLQVMRYHSLVVERDSIPGCLEVTATTEDGLVMGLRHRSLPLWGVQFHPESIGTPLGHALLSNFLSLGAAVTGVSR